jgi:hypothetical protein
MKNVSEWKLNYIRPNKLVKFDFNTLHFHNHVHRLLSMYCTETTERRRTITYLPHLHQQQLRAAFSSPPSSSFLLCDMRLQPWLWLWLRSLRSCLATNTNATIWLCRLRSAIQVTSASAINRTWGNKSIQKMSHDTRYL